MNKSRTGRRACDASDWLSLAAAPAFAAIALLTYVLDINVHSAAHDASSLNGMVPMYVLMSVFHSAPWLKLVADWRRGARQR